MKFNYARSVPDRVYVACSGGVDSVAAAAILSKWREVTLLHYHHGEHAGDNERQCVTQLATTLGIPLLTQEYSGHAVHTNSEARWRAARYEWFHSLDAPVVVAHTLNDATEWYLMTCLRGEGHYMEYSNKNVIRPFLLTDKADLEQYCVTNGIPWYQDPSNADNDFALRNRVRNILVPAALQCEHGLHQMVKRRLITKIKNNG